MKSTSVFVQGAAYRRKRKSLLDSRFFDPKRYDLASVGRYKINKSFTSKPTFNQRLAETLVDPETGEILAEKGAILDRRTLDKVLPYLENGIGFKSFIRTAELSKTK